ncbi:MAG: hypothetical protein JRJ12_13340, partial [Deltaproteobacteria bacterium]|nr:hypothetical protein [Deltaproteobacteria bacterium]
KFEHLLTKDPASGLLFFKRLARLIGERLVNSYYAQILGYPSQEHKTYGTTLTLQQASGEVVN